MSQEPANPKKPLTDAEYKVMAVVWDEGGEAPAKRIHEVLSKDGYERAGTYQLIHRCIDKGAIERVEPGFVCRALVDRAEMQVRETRRLANRLFGGSAERLLVSLVDPNATSQEEIDRLRTLVRDTFKDSNQGTSQGAGQSTAAE